MTAFARGTQAIGVGHAAEIPQPPSSAFDEIFGATFHYVWHTLRRLGVGERDLEDVTHDVFVAVFRHLPAYDPGRPIRPWLFAFAVRMATDYRRLAVHRLDLVEDLCAMRDPASAPEEQVSAREQLDVVAQALEMLAWERRVIFVLHQIDGVAIPEAAEILGIPTNTAYSRLRLARRDFAAAVRRLSQSRPGAR